MCLIHIVYIYDIIKDLIQYYLTYTFKDKKVTLHLHTINAQRRPGKSVLTYYNQHRMIHGIIHSLFWYIQILNQKFTISSE